MNSKQKNWLLIGPVIFSFAMAQKLYGYCDQRHEINPKGYSESGEAWSCRGCGLYILTRTAQK